MSKVATANRPYESLFIVPPETSQDTIDGFISKVKTEITKEKGNVRGVQVWGRRRLAYPIGRNKDGLYIYVDFDGSIQSVKSVDNLFRLSDIVIRHITVDREEFVPRKSRQRKPKPASPVGGPASAPRGPESAEGRPSTPPSSSGSTQEKSPSK